MHKQERRNIILRMLYEAGVVRVSELSKALSTSRATLWRDLEELAQQGLLIRVHGGATLAASRADPTETAATSAATERSGGLVIGMQVPSGVYYYPPIIAGARAACERSGARLIVGVSSYQAAGITDTIADLISSGAQALLISPSISPQNASDDPLRQLAELEVPLVLVEREPFGLSLGNLRSVATAADAGVFSAMGYLKSLGHQRVGLVTRTGGYTTTRIRRAWRDATDTLDLGPYEHDRVPVWGADDGAIEEILQQAIASQITALVCFNDKTAAAILQRARELGMSIPADLSVISYDDEIAANTAPALTAISPARERVGAVAATQAIEALLSQVPLQGLRTRIDPELVVRDSTCAPGSG